MKIKKTVSLITVVILTVCCCLAMAACDSPTLDRDYDFEFDLKTEVWGFKGVALFLSKDSGMKLTEDGEISITIGVNSGIMTLAQSIDFKGLSEVDLAGPAAMYAEPIIPWFDIKDIKGSLDALQKSLGGGLVLDYEEEDVQKLIESIQNTGHINEDFKVPKTVAIQYNGKYVAKKLKSEVTGKEYTALYVDKYSEGGEPFMIITLGEEDGKATANLKVEFLQADLYFIEK